MPDTPLSLLQRLQRQPDDEQWKRLVDMYSPWLHAWLRCYGVAAQDADDLMQEVLAVLVRELPKFQPNHHGAFRSWLRQILVHRFKDFRRQGQKRPAAVGGDGFDEMLAGLEAPDSQIRRRWDQEHDRHVLRKLLARIESEFSTRDWTAFRAVALDGQPAVEVAADLGVSLNIVLLAKSRVLRRLRQEGRGFLD